ncbi:MAG: amino acid--tRNA ligase-related protein [Pseudomonadota bacterium]
MKVASHPPKEWAHFIRRIREFFDSREFLEVFTPSLVAAGAFENALDPLHVTSLNETAQLHTSPEIEMKALLADHPQAIYQICKCFRDDPDTSIHFKEFTMLEFYRPKCTYEQTRLDMKELLNFLSGKPLNFEECSVSQLFREHAGINLETVNSASDFLEKAKEIGISSLSSSDTWEDIFFRIMIEKIENSLPNERPVIVYDYPASVSTLSQPKDSFWGERFEIFWKGMELCNGATELLSEELLLKRYEFESSERKKAGKAPHPFPHRLAGALKRLPPCSGVAVGLDRLFWALKNEKHTRGSNFCSF